MKVLVAIVLAFGSVSAIGSGPYLPSGWRPDGPAFYLPSEPRQPAVFPLKDVIFQGSEASGSDFLREYGPPRLQNLPNEVIEQSFVVVDAKEEGISVEAATEAIIELKSVVVDDPASSTTESLAESVKKVTPLAEEITVEGKSLNIEVEAEVDVTTEKELEATVAEVETVQTNVAEVEAIQAAVVTEDATPAVEVVETQTQAIVEQEASDSVRATVDEEATNVVEGVKNIAEAIGNLEKEVFAQQAQISQDVNELKSVEQNAGAVAVLPEGFLEYGPPGFQEYGPPGFKEYGPPKEDALLRNDDTTQTEEEKIENNETRRRRFSPKFRVTKKH